MASIALAIALVPAAAVASKVPKNFVGLAQGGPLTTTDLSRMQDIKVKNLRMNLKWSNIQHVAGGPYQWPDGRVAELASHGISPTFILYGTPPWLQSSEGVPPLFGKAKAAWLKFVKAAVNHYKPGGSFWRQHKGLRKEPARAWQIWNEPNLPKYFAKPGLQTIKQIKTAPKGYAKLVKATDKKIHSADKHAKVILAGLSGNPKTKRMEPQKFLKKFLKAKRITKHFDAAALHPYAPNIHEFKQRISAVRKVMKKHGAKHKQLWLTEVGWGSAHDGHPLNKGKHGQARLLKKSFKTSLKKHKKWKIGRIFWFDWRDPPVSAPVACTFCPSAGLLHTNGTPKPAYKDFKRFSKRQGKGGHHGGHGHHHHHHHHHQRHHHPHSR